MTLSFVQQWMNLLALLKYGLVFAILLVFLPLTAFEHVPAHGLLGGLFSDLTAWEIFFSTLALLGVAWCVMFGEGMVISGVERWSRHGQAYRPYEDVVAAPSGYVPSWAEEFFSFTVTRPQFLFFTLLAAPGFWVIVKYGSSGRGTSLFALAGGIAVGCVLLIALCTPAALVDWANRPARGLWLADRLWCWLRSFPRLVGAAQWLHERASRPSRWIGMTYILEVAAAPGQPRRLYAPYFNAIATTVGLALLVIGVALFFSPTDLLSQHMQQGESRATGEVRPGQSEQVEAPEQPMIATTSDRAFPRQMVAIVYLYVIMMVLVLLFTALQLHLGSLRISPLVVVLLVMLVGYSWRSVDHIYRIRPGDRPKDTLSPLAVAKAGPKGQNLVVVVASGGGILAAGWTTLALEKLTAARPQIQGEIRLLSTISGGSVGAAYYLDSMLRDEPPSAAHVKSTASSLAATAYGFAFLDLPRLLTGSLVSFTRDRGLLLEQEWLATANGKVSGETVHKMAGALELRPLRSLSDHIVAGKIPAPIFATTVMESGRRVMATPIDFGNSAGRTRADTLSEYLAKDAKDSGPVDVDLWTAARLSATFAFVSPAARANGPVDKNKELPTDHRAHHFIDGGYYDNFGVTSALDWLDPVLRARIDDPDLRFRRVLIVQLRAFRRADPREAKAASGAGAALLGPLLGLAAIRDGAAVSRNDIELRRFARHWNNVYRAQPPMGGPVEICIATLEPPPGSEGPLSWHLTNEDKKNLRKSWSPEGAAEGADKVTAQVTAYLDGKAGTCPEPVN